MQLPLMRRNLIFFLTFQALLAFLTLPAAAALPQSLPQSATLQAAGDAFWDTRFAAPGTAAVVNNLALAADGTLYGLLDERRITRWDGSQWLTIGETNSRDISSIVTVGNTLYVAGSFSAIGPAPVTYLARWTGSAWEQVGSGVGPEIAEKWGVEPGTILTMTAVGEMLYVGGRFDLIDGVIAGSIAAWDGAAWSALGEGVRKLDFDQQPTEVGEVHAIAPSGGVLYVGGRFQVAGEASAGSIARWDGDEWSALGGPIVLEDDFGNKDPGLVAAIIVSGSSVYAGGQFSEIDGQARNNIAAWNGSAWSALGAGVSGEPWQEIVKTLVMDGNNLLVGGEFKAAGGQAINHFARWTGSAWQAAAQIPADAKVSRLLMAENGTLYVAGFFLTVNDMLVENLAQRVGGSWQPFGNGLTIGDGNCCPGKVYAIADDSAGNIYVGGRFGYAGGVVVNNIAMWDGAKWQALGAGVGEGEVRALLLLGDELYVGGDFKTAGGASIPYLALYNTSSGQWSALGSGLNRNVYTLEFADGLLYAGGDFSSAGGVAVSNIAAWDGTSWFALSEKLVIRQIFDDCNEAGSQVYAIKASGRYLAIAGRFHMVQIGFDQPCLKSSYFPANNIVLWDRIADEWFFLGGDGSYGVSGGDSINPAAYALEVVGNDLESGGALYVGGNFAQAGLLPAPGIARFTLADSWQAIGGLSGGSGGFLSYPGALALEAAGTDLYVGGNFSTADSEPTNYVARYNTLDGSWSSLGSGADSKIYALAPTSEGLYIGGLFAHAGGKAAAGFSRYGVPISTGNVTPDGGTVSADGITLTFPVGAVSDSTNVQYTARNTPAKPLPIGQRGVRAFAFTARSSSGQTITEFAKPYTLKVSYTAPQLTAAGVDDPTTLNLIYWNGTSWMPMLPCQGCGIDTTNRVVTVVADHFTEFALVGEVDVTIQQVYLPMLFR